MRSVRLVAVSCLLLIGLFGCQRNPRAADPPPGLAAGPAELAGRWQLTLPAGAKYEVTVEKAGVGFFELKNAVRMKGVYEVQGNRLVIKPAAEGNAGWAWEIRGSDDLVLVAQPARIKEANYIGATMNRLSGAGPSTPMAGNQSGNNPAAAPAGTCRVSGQIVSSEYEKLGGSIERQIATVYQQPGRRRLTIAAVQGNRFEVSLAPGDYEVQCSAIGSRGATFTPVSRTVIVKEGQKDFDLGKIDLVPSVTTRLFGRPAPELEGLTVWKDTEPLTLSGLRGKVVVLEFWAHYDGAGVINMPALARLYEKYKGKGLEVLTIHNNSVASVEEMNEKMKGVVKNMWKKDLKLPTALDGKVPSSVFRAYGISAVPAVILVDQDGKVVRRFHHSGDPGLEPEIRRLLKE